MEELGRPGCQVLRKSQMVTWTARPGRRSKIFIGPDVRACNEVLDAREPPSPDNGIAGNLAVCQFSQQ